MPSHEGRQHLVDGEPIQRGVAGDALQRVDPAQADVELVVAELVDRATEPLGDLATLVQCVLVTAGLDVVPELPVRDGAAGEHRQPGQPLYQRGAQVVLKLEAVITSIQPRFALEAELVELLAAEWRVDKAGNYEDDRADEYKPDERG
jgi:hypothetical protein